MTATTARTIASVSGACVNAECDSCDTPLYYSWLVNYVGGGQDHLCDDCLNANPTAAVALAL